MADTAKPNSYPNATKTIQIKGAVISYDDLKKKLDAIPKISLVETEHFLKGDHWQGGNAWNGYRPAPEADTDGKTWLTITMAFTPKNVILGIVSRVVGAIFGKAPDFNVNALDAPEPLDDEAAEKERKKTEDEILFAEIDDQLVNWTDSRGVHEKLKEWVFNLAAYGKAAFRIYIPNGYLQEGNLSGKFEDVLSKIYVDVPHYSLYTDDLDENFGEKYTILQINQANGEAPIFEVCYVDPKSRQTVLRQVSAQDSPNEAAGAQTIINLDGENRAQENKDLVDCNLGGNLLTFIAGEWHKAMISPTVKQQQKTLNKAKTGGSLALDNINFPDTTFINADIPEKEDVKVNGKVVGTRPTTLKFGSGFWRKIKGIVTSDESGNEQIATPDVKFRDGADPEKFTKQADACARDMYEDAGMLYIYLQSSPYPSGDSRAEAMTDYLILLVALKTLCDQLGTWLLTTVIRFAFNFSGQQSKLNAFKVIFSSKVTIGRISNADKETMMKEVEMGARSLRNYMIVAEVTDDPKGEVMAYLVEKKQGWHNNFASAMKEKELTQSKELAEMSNAAQIEAAKLRPEPKTPAAGAGA